MNEQEMQLTELYHRYGIELQRLCYLYLKDYHLSEDAVSETFLRAWGKLPGFRGQASMKTWLTRIAINVCRNRLRSPAYRERSIEELTEAGNISEGLRSCRPEETEERLWVSGEIMALPVKYREVILLYYYQELTVKEIARLLHVPASTVGGRLKRAKAMLRSRLKEGYFDEA